LDAPDVHQRESKGVPSFPSSSANATSPETDSSDIVPETEDICEPDGNAIELVICVQKCDGQSSALDRIHAQETRNSVSTTHLHGLDIRSLLHCINENCSYDTKTIFFFNQNVKINGG
jgi:hypothetical protein